MHLDPAWKLKGGVGFERRGHWVVGTAMFHAVSSLTDQPYGFVRWIVNANHPDSTPGKSHYSQAGLQLSILLPLTPKWWDYRHAPLFLVSAFYFWNGFTCLQRIYKKDTNVHIHLYTQPHREFFTLYLSFLQINLFKNLIYLPKVKMTIPLFIR